MLAELSSVAVNDLTYHCQCIQMRIPWLKASFLNPPFVPWFCPRLRLSSIMLVFVLIDSLSTWLTTYADSPQSQPNPSLISTFRPHRLLASFLSYAPLATTPSSTPSSSSKSKKAVKIQSMNFLFL
jgi:hypothetical protein